jgi:hypothetical protein
MLWHTIFDFMVPLYHFIKVFNGTETPSTRRIYVRSDGVWSFQSLMLVFSIHPVTIIYDVREPTRFEKGVIGIEKLERNIDPKREYDASIGFHYDVDRSTGKGMREDVLRAVNISINVVGRNGKPLVLLVDRRSGSRNLPNQNEIYDLMNMTCPHCEIEVVQFHVMSVEEQIRVAARASVIIGLHGSGLAHVVWMAESRKNHTTHLVEILPYNYSCRDWYATAAEVAGVKYHSVMNRKQPEARTNDEIVNCWGDPRKCATNGCHDLLRDQRTVVEIDTFNMTWSRIVEELKTTIAVQS